MKKVFLSLVSPVLISIFIIGSSFVEEKTIPYQKDLAKVNRVRGIPVYVMSEPIDDYEVVLEISATLAYLAVENPKIDYLIDYLIRTANWKVSKGKIDPYDAILTKNGDYGTLIKFKDKE